MRKLLKDYLPPVLLETCEFPLLCLAEQPELDGLADGVNEVLDAQFVSAAPEWALSRYERIFGITSGDTDTPDERRFRILSRINAQLPYTLRILIQQLEVLCGKNNFVAEMDCTAHILTVKVALPSKRNFSAVVGLLKDIVPANIVRDCSLLYNPHATLAHMTHAQLASFSHRQVREEVLNNVNTNT